MDTAHDDRYLIFLRYDLGHAHATVDAAEQPLASCASYHEARRIRLALQGAGSGDCVIRYVGPAGGGD